jgi:hypothetical protein
MATKEVVMIDLNTRQAAFERFVASTQEIKTFDQFCQPSQGDSPISASNTSHPQENHMLKLRKRPMSWAEAQKSYVSRPLMTFDQFCKSRKPSTQETEHEFQSEQEAASSTTSQPSSK